MNDGQMDTAEYGSKFMPADYDVMQLIKSHILCQT